MKRRAQSAVTGVLILGMAIAAASPVGAAPAAASVSAGGSDLRAAFATSQDIAEGKRVAESSCASCHGINGIAKAKDTPHIAGQRPAYLYLELRVYQTGARGNTPMNTAVKFLSDDALVKVAAYYANLDPAPPAAGGSAKAGPGKPDPLSAGKAAAAGCAGCHGEKGISNVPGMPNLVGLDPKFFVTSIKAYTKGERKHDMMKTLVSALSDTDLENIALFYALQKPAKAQTPSPGNQAAGKSAAEDNRNLPPCHGMRFPLVLVHANPDHRRSGLSGLPSL